VEEKSAYPYITKFKKEPFKSFISTNRREIDNFYLSNFEKINKFYQNLNRTLLEDSNLNLEILLWFLLLRKYLKEDKKKYREEIFDFIKRCEVLQNENIGFKLNPNSEKVPDIYATYLALSNLKQLGLLDEYLSLDEQNQARTKIKKFILSHKKGNTFLHCLGKECDVCKNISSTRTLYYVIESFSLLEIDVRANQSQFRSYLGDRKRNFPFIFRLLCFKFLELELDVKEKEIQYLHQFQTENGGYSFDQTENINATFWLVYILDLYSWLLDYNPAKIYSFINLELNKILDNPSSWNFSKLIDTSKLIILLSLIWKKFINQMERFLFKQLEKDKFVDLNYIKSTFGLEDIAEELISYINLNYNFNLRILDNNVEFNNYIRNLDRAKQEFMQEFFKQIKEKSIISLSSILKRYKDQNREPLKLKEDIFPIIKDMVGRNFFKGVIKTRKGFLSRKKYVFSLNQLSNKIIVTDTDINCENLFNEKEKLEDIRNDIYNMTLKLEGATKQIQEEIESYLLIDEIEYAKKRLKFILRDTLMEADFLNENIENSFNEELYYINIQAALGSEIAEWKKSYSILQKRLVEVDSYLKGKIQEKEELRNLTSILDNLKEKIDLIESDLIKKFDFFKKAFSEILEKEYSDEKFNLLIEDLNKLSQDVAKRDQIIYKISQQITPKEKKIVRKHKKVIGTWIKIKEEFENEFKFYTDGFQFFNNNLKKIKSIKEDLNAKISKISENTNSKIQENKFQEAFDIIKDELDILLKEKIEEIKEFQAIVKSEIKSKQKLFLLYRYLQDELEYLEADIIQIISRQFQSLKNKVMEERIRLDIDDFDNFVSTEILRLKTELIKIKEYLNQIASGKIENVNKEFDKLEADFDKTNKIFLKKQSAYNKEIDKFDEKSKLTIIQWEKFKDSFDGEISVVRNELINKFISEKIDIMAVEKKTNNIKLDELKKELKISCKVLVKRLREMIEISKINGELYEEEKYFLIYSNNYYLNKELRNFIENKILKNNREKVGKVLALYDSSIRNRTLNVNMLELQNRIDDLEDFDEISLRKFKEKVIQLQINQEREENRETKDYFNSTIKNQQSAINNIQNNLIEFNKLHTLIEKQYNSLSAELRQYFNRFLKDAENLNSYVGIHESFENKKNNFKENIIHSQEKIDQKINQLSTLTRDSEKLIPEIREIFVKRKNNFFDEYNNKIERVYTQLEIFKSEAFREKLVKLMNDSKIQLSQLLGNLERKVEDNLEIKEFKKSNVLVQKRAKFIEIEIKEITKKVNNAVKDFNKKSKNFSENVKFIIEDFDNFIIEFSEILNEKVKSLERLIVKSYIDMTIKAVANEYLTIGFLSNELKIKKQNIQDHLLYLISSEELPGKYDNRFGIYFENVEILDDLDEAELEVIKNTNFKVVMALRHLKNFTSQYGSIIAFFASLLTMSYYLYQFSEGNPLTIIVPIVIVLIVISYIFLKRSKKEDLT